MRWQRLQLTDGPDSPAALFGPEAFAETVDSPDFAGLTFYVIHAKSIINRVPAESRMPFRHTVNPYRGCSHACTYCLVGDTPILMASGRTRPLRELRIGDKIIGTVRRGRYRRYVVTEVLNHWRTVKPAYRVRLADGTELIASGDHRFLSDRGWKHVTGGEQGSARRPHLTTNNTLMGTGRFAPAPKPTVDYRRGYLSGIIRGDGHLGSYSYRPRPGRHRDEVHHRFRLALADVEAIARAKEFLSRFDVDTDEFPFQRSDDGSVAMRAIRASSAVAVKRVSELVDWPAEPTVDWRKGFLAGIFDAEGHCDPVGGTIRISNSDPEIIAHIVAALTAFGFDLAFDADRVPANKTVRTVRIRGGLRERLRFFHTVDPAISRKLSVAGAALKAVEPIRVESVEALGFETPMFDITTGTGDFIADGVVSHNCFARKTHEYLNLGTGTDFDSKIVVKANAGRLLRKELAKPGWLGEPIAMGTNVDCYQRAEGRYRLMPPILTALRDAANPFSILTKGTLILRDLELLRQAAAVTDVSTAVSVSLDNLPLWKSVEPGTPRPGARLGVVAKLNAAGVDCSVLLAPILPFLTDSPQQLRSLVAKCAAAGATGVTPIVLHLRPGGAREWFLRWLWREHRGLVADYQLLYGGDSYADKEYQRHITETVAELADEYGIPRRQHRQVPPPREVEPPRIDPQPTLF